MDWLLSPLGLTIESQAEDYSRRLKDDRSGLKEWNAGDMLRDVFTPGTREDLVEAARKLEEGRLNKKSTGLRGEIQESLAGTQMDTGNLKIGERETAEEYAARLNSLQRTGAAILNAEATTPNFDRSAIGPGSTAGTVVAAQRGQTDKNKVDRETKDQSEVLRKEGRADKLLLMQMNIAAEDRRADRELRRDQQAYQNRALDLKESRLDRRDRQAAIQQMMAGLAQMGASIAI